MPRRRPATATPATAASHQGRVDDGHMPVLRIAHYLHPASIGQSTAEVELLLVGRGLAQQGQGRLALESGVDLAELVRRSAHLVGIPGEAGLGPVQAGRGPQVVGSRSPGPARCAEAASGSPAAAQASATVAQRYGS